MCIMNLELNLEGKTLEIGKNMLGFYVEVPEEVVERNRRKKRRKTEKKGERRVTQ